MNYFISYHIANPYIAIYIHIYIVHHYIVHSYMHSTITTLLFTEQNFGELRDICKNIFVKFPQLRVGLRLICRHTFKNNRPQFWRE